MFAQGPPPSPAATPASNIWWEGTVSDYLVAALCVLVIAMTLLYGMHRLVKACMKGRGGRRSRWGRVPQRDVEVATEALGRVIGPRGERF